MADPLDAENRSIAPMPDQATDPWIYRIAMGALAVVAGACGAIGGALVVKNA
jgi:hypothetical protein